MARLQISPGIAHPPSRLCPSDIRRALPYKYRASTMLAASPRHLASYLLPVRRASALPSASSRSTVARGTLAAQLTLPLVGRVEDFHLRVGAPCRAHHKKTPRAEARGVRDRTRQCPTFTWGDPTLSSALSVFTTEFEMDSGGSRSLWPPGKLFGQTLFWARPNSRKNVSGRVSHLRPSSLTQRQTAWVLYGQAARSISTG